MYKVNHKSLWIVQYFHTKEEAKLFVHACGLKGARITYKEEM
jgi:hypothetical protein